jgi:hypothetical protein
MTMPKKSDPSKRNPAAIALDQWLAKPGTQATMLGGLGGFTSDQYLQNRLKKTFLDGYDAAVARLTKPVPDEEDA